ncbi:MAG: cadherin repeat domain-containing protein, partial [Gammaproteobacteria bacterium]
MKKLLTFILSLGFFILLPNALADGEGGLSIKAPMSKQVQSKNDHVILMTLKVNNIQVRAEWRVNSVGDVFGIDAQSGVLSVLADKQQTLTATVFVEDQFNLLNPQYENLTASAVLTVSILGISLSDAPRLYANVGNAVSLHTFTARGGAGIKTYTIVASDEDYFTLDSASGVLSLRASATVGVYTLSVKVMDGADEEATALAIVEVVLPLFMAGATLYGYPGVTIHQFTASGGTGAKTYLLYPDNADFFVIDAESGILSVLANATPGVYNIYPLVVDARFGYYTEVIVEIVPHLSLPRTPPLFGSAGVAMSLHTFTASGGVGAKTYTVTA